MQSTLGIKVCCISSGWYLLCAVPRKDVLRSSCIKLLQLLLKMFYHCVVHNEIFVVIIVLYVQCFGGVPGHVNLYINKNKLLGIEVDDSKVPSNLSCSETQLFCGNTLACFLKLFSLGLSTDLNNAVSINSYLNLVLIPFLPPTKVLCPA